jgi:DNA-binding beta-propeller fold protein YncE
VVTSPLGTSAGGFVYTANSTANTISAFSYDSTGNLTPLAGSPYSAGTKPEGIAIDPTGSYLYVTNNGDGTVSAFTIAQTGGLTPLGAPVATGNLTSVPNPGPIDVKLDPSGQFMYVVNNLDGSVSLFTLKNGTPTLAGTVATGAGAVAVTVE